MLDGTARLSGHYVDLVPVTRLDYEFIFKLEVLGPSSAHYRFHGITEP